MITRPDNYLNKENFIFVLLLVLLLVDRYLLLSNFNFDYVGNDDLILWNAAKDYSQGIFHEPYFYGQDYNLMVEALFAVPLIWLQVPFNYALPLTTAAISLFPYVFFAFVLFKNNYLTESLVFLLIPLTLPIEYGMLCSMSRGFVQGIFFSGFFIFPLLRPNTKKSILVGALALGLGYLANPNSLIAALPCCLFLLFQNYKRLSFYLIHIAVLIPIFIAEFFAKKFYVLNPDYNTHALMKIEYSFSDVLRNLSSLDDYYSYFTPLVWSAGWLIVPVIFVVGCLLIRKDYKTALSLIVAALFIIFSSGVSKVNDSVKHLLLSSARMYIGIPLVAGLAFLWGRNLLSANNRTTSLTCTVIALAVFFVKISLFKPVVNYNTLRTNLGSVSIMKINELKCECEMIKKTAKKNQAELVVFVPNWHLNTSIMSCYDFGCPLLEKDMPPTVLSSYEKKTWVFLREKTARRKTVMLYGLSLHDSLVNNIQGCSRLGVNPDILLFNNNNRRLDSLLKLTGITYHAK